VIRLSMSRSSLQFLQLFQSNRILFGALLALCSGLVAAQQPILVPKPRELHPADTAFRVLPTTQIVLAADPRKRKQRLAECA
jgi:hypothetical protein